MLLVEKTPESITRPPRKCQTLDSCRI